MLSKIYNFYHNNNTDKAITNPAYKITALELLLFPFPGA